MKWIKLVTAFIIVIISVKTLWAQAPSVTDIPPATKTALNQMMDGYLKIETALLKGDPQEAGKAADELNQFITSVNISGLTPAQLKVYNAQRGKISHNTEHIRDNSKNYPHQCEHFDYLTDEFYALLKNLHFNTRPIYYNYTADGNEGNSAHWLTDKDEMGNPYFKGAIRKTDKRVATLNPQ